MRPLVEDTIASLKSVQAGHHVIHTLETDVPSVAGDRGKLVQVLSNLLDNAAKYSPKGGTITVSAYADEARSRVVIGVRDEGTGIAEEDHERVFETFQRVIAEETRDVPGTGLGLFLCKELVQAMGGEIWLESELGAGSTFSFSVPVWAPSR